MTEGRRAFMPWYCIVLLVCLVIGPFDALYLYIRAGRRRDEIRRREKQEGQKREEGK